MGIFKTFFFVFALFFMLGCLEYKYPAATHNFTVTVTQDGKNNSEKINDSNGGGSMKEYDSTKSFLAENDMAFKQLKIKVSGNDLKSFYGKLDCVYSESLTGYYDKQNANNSNKPSVYTTGFSSQDEFYMIIEDAYKVKVEPASTLRLFMLPAFEKQFDKSSAPTEEDKKRLIEEEQYGVTVGKQLDYCLQKNKQYYLLIRQDQVEYGPPTPDGDRSSRQIIFLYVSDREFVDGQPQVDPTSTFQGWTYD